MIMNSIKLLVLDVDGVLTDGRLLYTGTGEFAKSFHVHDGLGIKRLLQSNVRVAIISARESKATAIRAEELGINDVFLGIENKWEQLKQLCSQYAIPLTEVAYMGDDLPDLHCMKQVGLPIAPANATPAIKAIAKLVTEKKGGKGAVREAADYLLCDTPIHAKT